ncbi:MAG TPA: hypothetical protein VHV77_14500 [Pirellulales bacterium]|nr:hypothetical protein [Pirellulales bacterium]
MQRIVVEPGLGQKLAATPGPAVMCDAEGRVIGFFSPLASHPRIDELQLEPLLSIAETEELRKKNRTGKPLETILERLGF